MYTVAAYRQTHSQVDWLGLRLPFSGCLALSLHSLYELSELSQRSCCDDSKHCSVCYYFSIINNFGVCGWVAD